MSSKVERVVGPSGKSIKVGGPTWSKLTKAQQKKAMAGGFKKPVDEKPKVAKKAVKAEVKKSPPKKKAPAKKKPTEWEEAKKSVAEKKTKAKKTPTKKTELPAWGETLLKREAQKKKPLPKKPLPKTLKAKAPVKKDLPEKPCKSEIECSPVFQKSKKNKTGYWFITGDLNDCSSIQVDRFEASNHNDAMDRALRLMGDEDFSKMLGVDAGSWLAYFLNGFFYQGVNRMLIFSTPETDQIMKLLAREGRHARGESIPKTLTPTKTATPTPGEPEKKQGWMSWLFSEPEASN